MTHFLERLRERKTIETRRAVIRDELVARGMPTKNADAWCDAWEAEARRLNIDRRTPDYWTLGSVWIREQKATGRLAS